MSSTAKYLTVIITVLAVNQPGSAQSRYPEAAARSNVPGAQEREAADTILIAPQTRSLDTVRINGRRPLIENREGKTILNVAGSILGNGSSALEILSRAPGLTVDNEGNISLKGKQGVTILMDGKLTFLSPAQLTSLLRSTPGNTIQTIEIISNPSARYDAAGTGGIINIRLKKSAAFGTNGNLDFGAGYGTYHKSGMGLLVNHRNRSLNIFGNINYENNRNFVDLNLRRSTQYLQERTFFDQDARQIDKHNTLNYKIGIDYYIDDSRMLGFMVKSYVNNIRGENKIKTLLGYSTDTYNQYISATNVDKRKYKGETYNINYEVARDTSGQKFNADLDFAVIRNKEDITYNNLFWEFSGSGSSSASVFNNVSPSSIKVLAAKLDYIYPFNAGVSLESGFKSSFVRSDNELRSTNLIDGSWMDDASRQNRFVYQENINAAYLNLSKNLSSASVTIGLRAELTSSEGESVTLHDKTARSYFDLFPSISVNKNLQDVHDFNLGYSRRIERPSYQSLNPFVYYIDLYTQLQGNPALKPEYANSFDISYQYKKKLTLSFGYIRTKDAITTTLITDAVKKTLLLYEQNLASRRTLSAGISARLTPASWWSIDNDFTIYRRKFGSPDLMGLPFNNEKTTITLNTNHTIDINASLSAELSGNYTSSQAYGTYVARPIYGLDLGINKALANRRAHLKLSINDVLDQRSIKINSAIYSQDYQLAQKEESRKFRLTFVYNFGSNKIKDGRNRSGSSGSEQGRVRSGK
ncbi:MAG: outer membrane beta-barrel protein [Arcticibacter sp.]